MAYIAPSLTTFTRINPSYRVYELDATTFEVLDYIQFRTDLATTIRDDIPTWTAVYSARDLYDLPDMSAKSWHSLIDRMVHNDTLFNIWNDNYYTGFAHGAPSATDKANALCKMRGTTQLEVDACIDMM